MTKIISTTKSVCPECLTVIDAARVEKNEKIWLEKECPEHGAFSALIWEGDEKSYLEWNGGDAPVDGIVKSSSVDKGCPFDCGLCSDHVRTTCCVLLELTSRCNLSCPICFADAGLAEKKDPSISDVSDWYDMLLSRGGPFNIQLSGGEPTIRDDLPEIIKIGKEKGFTFFQLNTNGLRIAREKEYAMQLKDAGLDCVFLAFDGLSDSIYKTLRGEELLSDKIATIDMCEEIGLGVVLVPTIASNVNENEIGDILRYAESRMPVVRGVHFQPLSRMGRHDVDKEELHITIPRMLKMIEEQTNGRMLAADFACGGAESAYCSFHANYFRSQDGELTLTGRSDEAESCCCSSSAQSREVVARQWSGVDSCCCDEDEDEFSKFIRERKEGSLAISCMLFQDAYTLDLERLKQCYLNEVDSAEKLIPFCAYNLTSISGKSLYRNTK